ncbi:MAG: DUF3393 domain-containing protein [Gammaproteobacteria bacterium]|nr:DUF3393 domain-containing protein [Gammaproteobacteria bacterium]
MIRRLATVALSLAAAALLTSCASSPQAVLEAARSGDAERVARVVLRDELSRRGLPGEVAMRDIENLPVLVRAVRELLRERWGEEEPEVASEKRYVKYTNAYEARAIIDFEQGWLRVETIATEAPLQKLRDAIVTTLLTPRNMSIEDIFTDADPTPGSEPFLLGQILDQDDEPIRWQWRAERFADHLIANALERSRHQNRTLHAVTADLIDGHLHLRQLEYADYVIAASRQYRVAPSVIYAVIEVESAFNPYAVSAANAYGLMQVVPATAGRDVYQRIKNLPGEPTRQQLFQPAFNIDVGSAYLHLLDGHYLNQIRHAQSRHYTMIAAYNGGPGSVWRAFHDDRSRALDRINGMSPTQVYQQIVAAHPFGETRRYLEKVRAAEVRYR